MNLLLRELLVVALCVPGAFAGSVSAAPPAPKAEWRIKVEEDKDGKPHSTVDLVINEKQVVRIALWDSINEYGNRFEILPLKDYANYRVPAKALCACFSFWEGLGGRLYAIVNRKGDVEVYRMDEDEEGRRVPWEHAQTIRVKNR